MEEDKKLSRYMSHDGEFDMKNHDEERGSCWDYLILIREAPKPKLSNNSECRLLTFMKSALTLV